MRRRRRKPRVIWLPNTGTLVGGSPLGAGLAAQDQSSAIVFNKSIAITVNSPTTTIETPMVLDNDPDTGETTAGLTLAARQQKAMDDQTTIGYRLRRIVGSCYVAVSATGSGAGSSPAAVLVQAGIIVRRIDPGTGLSLAFVTSNPGDLEVGNLENNADPWVWRKDWLLTPILSVLSAGTSILLPVPDAGDEFRGLANTLPRSNVAVTGPNGTATVDQKTARRISAEERLFFDITVTVFNTVPQEGQAFDLSVFFPYRALATLGLTAGNRRNASR